MDSLCIRCKGKGWCGKRCRILDKFMQSAPKVKLHFSGSSPPEVFVGRINYPNVFSGILAPVVKGDTMELSSPEEWVGKDLSIEQILEMRGQLIYGRSQGHIKSFSKVSQEIAMSSKPVSTEFFLKKQPRLDFTPSKFFSIMTNPAPIQRVILEENPKIDKKVDYLVSDYDVKAVTALEELYKSKIQTSHLQRLFASGLLGVKVQRRLVPTRWSITAVDDTLGKGLLENIRNYPELNDIQLFHNYYNGNHFEILLLPGAWSFEVIEVSLPGNVWGGINNEYFMQDYEGFFPRKKYAGNVVGAYYADRLGVCEYLNKIQRQASVLVLHEERAEYYAPLGVGIIRESIRKAMQMSYEKPSTIEEALRIMSGRLKASFSRYKEMSWIINNYGKQKRISDFLS